jgi:hypothetical protein
MKLLFILTVVLGWCRVIDVVIPSVEKDLSTLEECIASIKKHGQDIGRVIVVSPTKLTNNAEWFPEENYPFSKKTIADRLNLPYNHSRLGWMLQQFLKLYAPFVIPEISSDVLILDSDTMFLKRMQFFFKDRPLYATHKEMHPPFFAHIERLLPHVPINRNVSGVIHHMIFQKAIMQSLFDEIRSLHSAEPWEAICDCIDMKEINTGSFSEYEIYFSYVFHKANPKIRNIKWKAIHQRALPLIHQFRQKGYLQITCHNFI